MKKIAILSLLGVMALTPEFSQASDYNISSLIIKLLFIFL